MEITVDRIKTIEQIETEKKEYEKEYTKSVDLYKRKLGEYAKYVERVALKNPMDGLKSPPHPPTSHAEAFDDSIECLKAHVPSNLKMTDSEYKELRSGIRQAHFDNISTVSALNAISY